MITGMVADTQEGTNEEPSDSKTSSNLDAVPKVMDEDTADC